MVNVRGFPYVIPDILPSLAKRAIEMGRAEGGVRREGVIVKVRRGSLRSIAWHAILV